MKLNNMLMLSFERNQSFLRVILRNYRFMYIARNLVPCHSTTSFSESVIVTEKSYQMLEVLSFFDRERG